MAAAAALVAAAGVGIWAGHATTEEPSPDATRTLHAGAATLTVPREWRTVASHGGTVALAPDPAQRVVVSLGPVDDASLVPRALRELARGLGRRPRETLLAGQRAWLYAGLRARNGDALSVTVLPSARGVLGIGCASSYGGAAPDCARSVASVSLGRALLFAPSDELALRLRLPRVLAGLNGARVRSRAALRASATPAGQARLAADLAGEHRAAAAALRPVAGRAGAPLLASLTTAADAYAALGRAARGSSAERFAAARGGVRSADAHLAAAVQRLASGPAPRPLAAATAIPPAHSGFPSLALVVFGLLAIGTALLWKPATRAITSAAWIARGRRLRAATTAGAARSGGAATPAAAARSGGAATPVGAARPGGAATPALAPRSGRAATPVRRTPPPRRPPPQPPARVTPRPPLPPARVTPRPPPPPPPAGAGSGPRWDSPPEALRPAGR